MRRLLVLLILIGGVAAAPVFAQAPTTVQLRAPVKQTAAWTSATSQDTAVTATITNLSHVVVTIATTGAINAGGLYFEFDDGSATWWSAPATQTGGIGAGTLAANGTIPLRPGNTAWEFNLPGWTSFRVRLNPTIAGGGTVNIGVLVSAGSDDPIATAALQSPGLSVLQPFVPAPLPRRGINWTGLVGTLGQPLTSTGGGLDVNLKYPPKLWLANAAAPTWTEGTMVWPSVDLHGSSRETLLDSGGTTITDTTAHGARVLQVDASGNIITVPAANPCAGATPTQVAISQTASTKVISATSAKKNYICSIVLVVGAAEIVNVVEGTGSTCGTSTTAVAGSATAANGMSFAANGGVSAIGGASSAMAGIGTNVDTCLTQNGANRVAGWLTYVQQ